MKKMCQFSLIFQQKVAQEINTSLEGFNNSLSLAPFGSGSQVTEAIVDVALSENRRFAVVPCCVFAERFAHRELEPGDGSEIVGIAVLHQDVSSDWQVIWVWLNIADDRNPLKKN